MNEFTRNFIKQSSVPLDGGDTHIDPWANGRGFTVTTRLRGGFEDHQNFRFKQLHHTPSSTDGLRRMPW